MTASDGARTVEATLFHDCLLHLETGPSRGDLLVEDGAIAALGDVDLPPAVRRRAVGGKAVVPGLVDLQVNGFGGAEVAQATPEALRRVLAALPASGCTAALLTMISAPRSAYEALFEAMEDLDPHEGARVIGLHLEGPYLNPDFRGAHPAHALRPPDPVEAEALLDAAGGLIRLWTVAPELPGAGELIDLLRSRGVVVAAGHSGLGLDEALEWFERGISLVTHLFNAMPPLHHRAPGLVGAALIHDEVRVSVIADGWHVDPACLRLVERLAGDRLIVVTDAVAAAGMADGECSVARAPALARDGVVRRADGRLAGSATPAVAALGHLRRWTGRTLAQVLPAMTSRPADVLGLGEVGRLVEGAPADFLVLDDGALVETWVGGRLACAAGAP